MQTREWSVQTPEMAHFLPDGHMKFGIVIFPGSTSDYDTQHVLKNVLKQTVVELWHKEPALPDFDNNDCILLTGGFWHHNLSPEELTRQSPIMTAIAEFAASGGYVWGIGDGFKVLCETGLLPGTLLENNHQRFVCKNVFLSPMTRRTAITSKVLDLEIPLKIPVAHASGRYDADAAILDELEENDQVLFKYCTETGAITAEANPNGSSRNIAGICNAGRNVFGIMPHPERASEEQLGNIDGRILFESIVETVQMTEAV